MEIFCFRRRRLRLSGWGRNGAWGAAPWDIAAYLREQGVAYRRIRSYRELEALAHGEGVFIVSYWNKPFTGGYHTVAIRREGTRFLAYNHNCASPVPAQASGIGRFLPGRGRFISGFFVPYPQSQ